MFKTCTRKFILILFLLTFITSAFAAQGYKTRQNPWTGKPDFTIDVTSIEATNITASGTVTGVVVSATDALQVGSDYISDITGTGLSIVGGKLTSIAAGGESTTVSDTTTIDLTLTGADITADGLYTAGDALTLTGADFDFDGGASPGGDLGGTWASPTVDDDSHDHSAAGSTVTINAADIIDANAGTNITADLEEEVTEGSLADSTIVTGDIKDGTITGSDISSTANLTIANLTASDTVTGIVVDTQYIEYSSGNGVTVRDGLEVIGTLTTPTITNNTNIKGQRFHIYKTIIDPLSVQTEDNEICLVPAIDAAITITKIEVTLDATTNEVAGDLKYADTFIGLASPTVINDFDTTSGVRSDSSITSGAVASGKCIYLSFDSAPNTAIKQMAIDITYDYD